MDVYLDGIRRAWDEHADHWYLPLRTEEAIDKVAGDPSSAFHPRTLQMIRHRIGDLRGKKILVPSSGDNHAVYAFHLMGAKVTSADLSPRQIELSQAIAARRGWDIGFAVCNTMTLDAFADDAYDFVYTSNGVHIWINNLRGMYDNIARVLRPGGAYVMYDVHPFMRPFADDDLQADAVRVLKPYDDGPSGNQWRMQDILNAIAEAGLCVRRVEELASQDGMFWFRQDDDAVPTPEMLERAKDWRINPLAALPQWLCICAEKGR